MSAPDYDYEDDIYDGVGCCECHYEGWRIVCPDDMCRGQYDGGPWAPCGKHNQCVKPCGNCNPDGMDGF